MGKKRDLQNAQVQELNVKAGNEVFHLCEKDDLEIKKIKNDDFAQVLMISKSQKLSSAQIQALQPFYA